MKRALGVVRDPSRAATALTRILNIHFMQHLSRRDRGSPREKSRASNDFVISADIALVKN